MDEYIVPLAVRDKELDDDDDDNYGRELCNRCSMSCNAPRITTKLIL
jgi:hypothetical protein